MRDGCVMDCAPDGVWEASMAGLEAVGCARRVPMALLEELALVLGQGRLRPVYQPILDLKAGVVHGFEGLIRGPSDSLLHGPEQLFRVGRAANRLADLDEACLETVLGGCGSLGRTERVFVNASPSVLPHLVPCLLRGLERHGLSPDQVVVELTETHPSTRPFDLLAAVTELRAAGVPIALDDLGEGFSHLRLWMDLRPEYVKVDKCFVQGISLDPVKHQFLQSLLDIARRTGTRVVAEGIETEADLSVVYGLGVDFAQGYFLGRPTPGLAHGVLPDLLRRPKDGGSQHGQGPSWIRQSRVTAARLLQDIAPVSPDLPTAAVVDRFMAYPDLQSLPVVAEGLPVGLIHRHAFMDSMAKQFRRELYGKRPCSLFMTGNILVVDHAIGLHELSRLIVESDPHHILHGFILTRDGRYAGLGSGHDLMREITHMQVTAARYANPLTGLPGNVPIQEHLDDLIAQGLSFVACYTDLDHFKPYNDAYGYRLGDEVIAWTGKLLEGVCEPGVDFLGHIGGDDFLLVLRSPDWEARCRAFLAAFEAGRARFHAGNHLAQGGYWAEDRQRREVFHPLLAVSIGAVAVGPGDFPGHHEIAAAASGAKREAKRQEGCSLFLERRRLMPDGRPGPYA